ncbi:MAG TPA: acyloxyacyl hydrolase [Phycisphaerales bacterium]|nr:acyloxyacyl hydrolase [Phycisphaerales bacterium]HMP38596.1 acyloxyacyl hydrolase [Phycisphaerales bacterium]
MSAVVRSVALGGALVAGPVESLRGDDATLLAPAARESATLAAGPVEQPLKLRFGAADSMRLNILGAYANDFDDASQASAGVGFSWFFVDDLSLDLEFLGAGIFQPGPDTAAFNGNLLFRWHAVSRERWSLYFEAGAGLLFAGEDVPQGGTPVNFTPQAGFGTTFDIGDDTRLIIGVRWYHISNARASRDNPGRDSLMFVVGLSLPF